MAVHQRRTGPEPQRGERQLHVLSAVGKNNVRSFVAHHAGDLHGSPGVQFGADSHGCDRDSARVQTPSQFAVRMARDGDAMVRLREAGREIDGGCQAASHTALGIDEEDAD